MPSAIVEALLKDVSLLKNQIQNLHSWVRWSLGFSVGTFLCVAGALFKYVIR